MVSPLDEAAQWEDELHALEADEDVAADGAVPGDMQGASNRLPRQLGNRTLWLKEQLTRAEVVQLGTPGGPAMPLPRARVVHLRHGSGLYDVGNPGPRWYEVTLPEPEHDGDAYETQIVCYMPESYTVRVRSPHGLLGEVPGADERESPWPAAGPGHRSYRVHGLHCVVMAGGHAQAAATAGRSEFRIDSVQPQAAKYDEPTTFTLRGRGFLGIQRYIDTFIPSPLEIVSDTELRVTITPDECGFAPGDEMELEFIRNPGEGFAAPPTPVQVTA